MQEIKCPKCKKSMFLFKYELLENKFCAGCSDCIIYIDLKKL